MRSGKGRVMDEGEGGVEEGRSGCLLYDGQIS